MSNRYGVVLILLLLSLLSACAQTPEAVEADVPVPVQVAEVQKATVQLIVTAEGILHPVSQASITSKISAPIGALHVNRGDRVAQGQLLAELESRDISAAVAESEGLYIQAQSAYRSTSEGSLPEDLRKAELDVESATQETAAAKQLLDNRQQLAAQGALARKLVDEANVAYVQARNQLEIAKGHLDSLRGVGREETLKNLQAQIASAKARYDGAQVQLSYAHLVSPISGIVTDRPVFAGEMASAGAVLMTIMDTSRVVARVNVPSQDLRFIKAGNEATIVIPGRSEPVPGKVTVVSPALDPNSTTAEVWVEADNPRDELRPGITVSVAIVAETVEDAVVVPLAALLPTSEGEVIVMTIAADSVAHEVPVEIGIRGRETVQILKGLDPGERVVVVGGLGLEDKAKVSVVSGENPDSGQSDSQDKDDKSPK